jgi:APA family basic amino acid/polyamine antiporter
MQPQEAPNNELKRSLGLLDATMIVAGTMIGSGIFIVSADIARNVGSAGYLLLLWIISGIIIVTAALSYGELAGMMPKAGGQYVYIRRAYNPFIAFLYGWTVFMVIQTGGIAAVSVAFAKFSSVFFPVLNNIVISLGNYSITYAKLYAICGIVLLTFLNSRGIKNGKIIQLLFTSTKIIALLALVIIGLFVGLNKGLLTQNFHNMWNASQRVVTNGSITDIPLSGWALAGVMGSVIISSLYSGNGWNNVTFIAGEIREPQKNIPRSLLLGTSTVVILYIFANLAYLTLLPLKGDPNATTIIGQGIQFASNDRVGTAAASMIFGNIAVYIMAALIMISTFGCANGIILSGARLYYAMAQDGLFFKKAGELNSKQVPGFALAVQSIWASLLCLSGKYGDLLEYAMFASLVFYIITIGGIFILRKKEPGTARPYKAFGYPFLPALYILVTAAICIDLLIYKTTSTGAGVLIVLLGIPVYFISKRAGNRSA